MRDRTKKPLAIILSDVGRGSRGRDCGSDLTSVQIKPIWNCCNEPPPHILRIHPNKKIFKWQSSFWQMTATKNPQLTCYGPIKCSLLRSLFKKFFLLVTYSSSQMILRVSWYSTVHLIWEYLVESFSLWMQLLQWKNKEGRKELLTFFLFFFFLPVSAHPH
jgi:hypothetical protein